MSDKCACGKPIRNRRLKRCDECHWREVRRGMDRAIAAGTHSEPADAEQPRMSTHDPILDGDDGTDDGGDARDPV